MNTSRAAGTIVLSGPMPEPWQLSPETRGRLAVGLNLWQETGLPLILVGSSSEFMFEELGELSHGPAETEIYLEPKKSRDTVGNAIYSKRDILEPNGFAAANLVTSDYHIKRATTVFRRVLGHTFQITPVEAVSDFSIYRRRTLALKEMLYTVIDRAVLSDYDPARVGDNDKVMARMRRIARTRYQT